LIAEQKALRAELITTKIRAERAEQAGTVFSGIRYERCPECGRDLSGRPHDNELCCLCGTARSADVGRNSLELEVLRRDLNERIDQIGDSITRRERERDRMLVRLVRAKQRKASLDRELQEEPARYDSAFIESMRGTEREIATLVERISSLQRLHDMPQAINALEEEAGALQGRIDQLKTSAAEEQKRLRDADENILAIAAEFKRIMLSVDFPGVSQDDRIVIDPRH
jgi:DNA repair exonuclease SbcCD ATPase subunit